MTIRVWYRHHSLDQHCWFWCCRYTCCILFSREGCRVSREKPQEANLVKRTDRCIAGSQVHLVLCCFCWWQHLQFWVFFFLRHQYRCVQANTIDIESAFTQSYRKACFLCRLANSSTWCWNFVANLWSLAVAVTPPLHLVIQCVREQLGHGATYALLVLRELPHHRVVCTWCMCS